MRTASRVFQWILFVAPLPLLGFAGIGSTQSEQKDATVVFVCEHGNVKSLIASSLFNQVARQRGLPYRSVSRGVAPEDGVPPRIVEALRRDGTDVSDYKPSKITADDEASARRIVAIGVELTNTAAASPTAIETWNDVPPASVDYPASRAALLRHIDALLADLQAHAGQ
jgi:arsenate reductase